MCVCWREVQSFYIYIHTYIKGVIVNCRCRRVSVGSHKPEESSPSLTLARKYTLALCSRSFRPFSCAQERRHTYEGRLCQSHPQIHTRTLALKYTLALCSKSSRVHTRKTHVHIYMAGGIVAAARSCQVYEALGLMLLLYEDLSY